MAEIENIHDKFFKRVFRNPKNTRAFLKGALPQRLRRTLDLAHLHIDPTNFISKKFKERFSDIVVKTRVKKGKNKDDY